MLKGGCNNGYWRLKGGSVAMLMVAQQWRVIGDR